jgi:hypothetical protein
MFYLSNLIAHTRAVYECLPAFEARASLDLDSFRLDVRARGKRVELHPQFIMLRDGALSFTPRLMRESSMFLGWRHYVHRVWPIAADKVLFKQFCEQHGLLTPRSFDTGAAVDCDVVLKRSRASFGTGMRAPITAATARAQQATLMNGEFFEQFVPGETAKVWYWNERPVCIEAHSMPTVRGNGSDSFRALLMRKKPAAKRNDWPMWEAMAAYQRFGLDDIVPEGRELLADFRYLSPLHPDTFANENVYSRYENTPVMEALQHAGRGLYEAVPLGQRENVLFTADAIFDREGRVWLLEMNCNSVVHPDLYPTMFEAFFGAPTAAKTDWSALEPSFTLPRAALSA